MADKSSILERLSARPSANGVEDSEDVLLDLLDEEQPALGQTAFTLVRGVRQLVPMVEFRQVGGNSRAFGYAYLVAIEFNPTTGIVLNFGAAKVTLRGRNLRPLFAALRRHTVTRVYECSPGDALEAGEKQTVVMGIVVGE
jgi:hypothetical protein